ncbi:12335_t:CDS:2, partial [Cetraspora pellucida]
MCMPLSYCLVENNKLNVINLPVSQKIIRTEDQMQQVIALKQGKDYLLHEETNGLFEKNQNELFVQMFVNWNKMYNQSKQYKFTPSDLYQFE